MRGSRSRAVAALANRPESGCVGCQCARQKKSGPQVGGKGLCSGPDGGDDAVSHLRLGRRVGDVQGGTQGRAHTSPKAGVAQTPTFVQRRDLCRNRCRSIWHECHFPLAIPALPDIREEFHDQGHIRGDER